MVTYFQKYHFVSHAMQTHAFKLSWCTACTMLRNPCPKIHAPTPLWCIACTHCYRFFACAASRGSFQRYFDCSKACDALAEEAVVWICTCVSGLQILLRSSYVIAARLLLRNRSLIALLKIRTEQEFKKHLRYSLCFSELEEQCFMSSLATDCFHKWKHNQ